MTERGGELFAFLIGLLKTSLFDAMIKFTKHLTAKDANFGFARVV
jgi:hypothetical protein